MTRWMRSLLVAAVLLAGAAACGDGGDEDLDRARGKLGEAWDAVKAYSTKKRQQAETLLAEGMVTLKAKFEAAKEKAAAAGGEAAQALDERWAAVQEKLEAMKTAGTESWEKARDAFMAAYEAFQKELEGD